MSDLARVSYAKSRQVDWSSIHVPGWQARRRDDLNAIIVKSAQDISGLDQRLGFKFPPAGRFTRAGDLLIAAQGPRQWLVLVPGAALVATLERLQRELEHTSTVVSDYTDALSVIQIEGADASTLLSRGSGSAGRIPSGGCASTAFAQIPATLIKFEEVSTLLCASAAYENFLFEWMHLEKSHFLEKSGD